MRVRFVGLLLSCILIAISATAQTKSDNIKPKWFNKIPVSLNKSYSFEAITASGNTLSEARDNCLAQLLANSGLENGVAAVANNISDENVSQVYNNGRLTETVKYNSKTTVDTKSSQVSLQIVIVDEYWQTSAHGYMMTTLYAKSETNSLAYFDNFEPTKNYGASGLWRSIIVPGWGQIHKGSMAKGCAMLGSIAALSIGAVFANDQVQTYNQMISQTYDVNSIRTYATNADNYSSVRNICIGAAAAIYIYNVVDAIVAPGARRILVKRNNGFASHFSASPTLYSDGSVGVVANINF